MSENAIQRRAARRQAREARRTERRQRSGLSASSLLLWAGGGATAASLVLRLMGKNKAAGIVGVCGSSLLVARMATRMIERRSINAQIESERSTLEDHPELHHVSPPLAAG